MLMQIAASTRVGGLVGCVPTLDPTRKAPTP